VTAVEQHDRGTPAQAYATNLLVVKEHCDPETGIQRPDPSVIADAKARVDENEK
jgi:hypothetical protein